MVRRLYALLLWLLAPAILLFTLWRAWRRPPYRDRWWQRFGWLPSRKDSPLWIHAVSVGETVAALPLVRALRQHHPDIPVLLTTTTPTGAAIVAQRLGQDVSHVYLPYDLPFAVRRFLRRQHPRLGLLMETELWPNLLHEAGIRKIPMLLLNGRLSARSLRGYARWRMLFAPALQGLALVAAQTPGDAEGFRELGAAQVVLLGQIKLDIEVGESVYRQGHSWRHLFGARRVWVFASTHEGEESLAAAVLVSLRQRHPDLLLVLAPRHPERGNAVAGLLQDRGFSCCRRSGGMVPGPDTDVFVVDSLGELMDFYAAADVVTIGGSFVARGGHNPIEPAALGRPIIVGPHMENFRDLCFQMREAGALIQTQDATGLEHWLETFLEQEQMRTSTGQRALQWLAGQQGALQRTLDRIEKWLPLTDSGIPPGDGEPETSGGDAADPR